jgi:PAS domain S-box-containing protein
MLLADVESKRFILSNRQLQRMLGYAEDDILQLSIADIHPTADVPRIIEKFEQQARGEITLAPDLPVLRKDGTVFHADISAATISFPQHSYILGIFRDITERKQAEKMLRDEQKRMSTILDTVGDPIFVKDNDHRFVLANRAFYEMLGLDPNAVIGRTLAENLPAEEMRHFFKVDRQVLDTGITDLREETLTVKGGLTLTILTRKARFVDDSGNAFVVGAIHDLTDRKRAEAREMELLVKLERGTRMEALGVLAGGVAHDLNNVLGPIVALPDMVIEYFERVGDPAAPEHAETLESLQMMKASALRAAGVVSDLVVMSRRGQFQKEPVDLNRVVEQMLDSKQIRTMQARRLDVQVSKRLSSESLWCLGSESRLVRVLANLTNNAIEAIYGQGDVIVRTGRQVFTETHYGFELVPAGDYVTLEVIDTGCGMDDKTIVRIFEPFFSTKSPTERSGSGLGLSVVHGLVKDHAGFLDVKSKPGKGTSFTIYLPTAAAKEDVPELTDVPTVSGGSERILVVDDEPGQRLLTRQTLKKIGYDATVVANGEEAAALFEMAKRGGEPAPFDLVMTDMIMNGLNGLATCKAILTLYPAQKLMIISGHMPDEYEQQVEALGAEWLSKPFTTLSLARAVRSRLDR